jgi:hypothetical protein
LLVRWWFSVARQRLQNKFCNSNFSDVANATPNSQSNPALYGERSISK